jgi:hypothetical protein
LRSAKSDLPAHQNGAEIYTKWVKPGMIDMMQVAAHYAMSSLFDSYHEQVPIHCSKAEREDFQLETKGKMQLVVGRAQFSSQITRESSRLSVYSLRSILRDEQRKILRLILNDRLTDTEAAYRALYEPSAQLIHAWLPFSVQLWDPQNTLDTLLIKAHQEWQSEAEKGTARHRHGSK